MWQKYYSDFCRRLNDWNLSPTDYGFRLKIVVLATFCESINCEPMETEPATGLCKKIIDVDFRA